MAENHPHDNSDPLAQAYHQCAILARKHYENFPVGSLITPLRFRKHIHAVYAFARTADDFADEGDISAVERLRKLDEWQDHLQRCVAEPARHPVFAALGDTIRRFHIPIALFADLLTAFRTDVTKSRYETYEELLGYCRCSANPVGRILLLIFGASADNTIPLSDSFCTALQLTNFWQDLSRDLQKNRIYIPLEDIGRFGYTPEDLQGGRRPETFRPLVKFQVDRTKQMFDEAAPLPSLVGGRPGLELSLTWHGGSRILRKIERMRYDVIHQRPRLNAPDIIAVISGALLGHRK